MVYKHHACHAGKHDHDGRLWITVRPVTKRVFVFRYIESLGQKKIMVVLRTSLSKIFAGPTEKNRLSRAVGTSNLRGLQVSRK